MRMTAHETLIDLLRDRAAVQPDDRAFTFLDDGERCGDSLTWLQLERRSRAIATAVMQRAEPGARVLVMFPPSLDFVPAFFATLYAGAVAVPTYPPSGARADRTIARLRGMVADAGVTLVLAPAALAARAAMLEAAIPELAGVRWLDPLDVPDEDADDWRAPAVTGASLAFLQYTSGSTSAPRGVMVSHANLLHNLAQTEADGLYGPDSVSVSWLPVNHDMGLINGVLQPVFSGCPGYLMAPTAFLQRPARWLQAISRLGGTHSGGPNFAYDLCARKINEDDAAGLDLSSWQVAYSGSEPVRRSTLEQFQRIFGIRGFRWEAFSPAYGLAEATLLVANIPAGVPPTFLGEAVASGTAPASRGVVIVDPVTHAECRTGQKGEIWVASDSVAAGYWKREADTAATFQAFTSPGEGPFLRTGDMGFIHHDRLYVSGRIKDLIIVRGMKHYPQDIELTAERAHPALRPGCCAAFAVGSIFNAGVEHDDERLAIVAEVDPKRQVQATAEELSHIIAAIRLEVAGAHHLAPSSVTLVVPGAVPKTTSGKLQRYLCRDALITGALEALASWAAHESQVEADLAEMERAS
jgi:acyl-CoA synthetase (AMP-forming)/AMP-acid ligase II